MFYSPDDGMVDVTDLGSVFWQFKSASGHHINIPTACVLSPLGEMVDTVALKATLLRGIGSSPVAGKYNTVGSYSLSVK